MQISESIEIEASENIIWNNLRTLEGAEKYIPVVTKSSVEGNGIGTKRTCDIQMGDQSFQIMEILEKLDDQQKSLTISISNGPLPLQGTQFTFLVTGYDQNKSTVSISSEVNPESTKMIQDILKMITMGLKTFHEN